MVALGWLQLRKGQDEHVFVYSDEQRARHERLVRAHYEQAVLEGVFSHLTDAVICSLGGDDAAD